MNSLGNVDGSIRVEAENIGGIDRTEVAFDPGVTILTGRNATNRTSFLQALMAGFGSDQVSLKADATEGRVTLAVGDETYRRHLRRENGSVVSEGETYLEDPAVADLFVFLTEDNEARQAVKRGGELRDLIMRPVDTEAIRAEIEDLTAEKREVDRSLETLSELEERLPALAERRDELEERIEETRAELEEKREELQEADVEIEDERETQAELDEKLDELREVRSELEDVRYRIDTEGETLDELREQRSDLESELESVPEGPPDEIETLEARIDRLHDRKEATTGKLDRIQKIVRFNEEMLEEAGSDLDEVAPGGTDAPGDGSVTDRLVEDRGEIECWTCGSPVERHRIESTLDELRELRRELTRERREITSDIDEVRSEKRELVDRRQKREQLERKLDRNAEQIESHERSVADLESRRDELSDRIESLEEEITALKREDRSELLELHGEANELEFEIRQLEDELGDVEEELESVRERLQERDELEDRRERIQEELRDLRTRVKRIENEAVEEFNTNMASLLDELEYRNIERVWLERVEREVREGRRKVEKSAFDLHIVRESESGDVFEDTIDNLSESEREVVGIVFALAGYLAHDLHEDFPFIVLDSIEALDSERIVTLVEYMETYAESIVVALLPEDASEFDRDYQRITEI